MPRVGRWKPGESGNPKGRRKEHPDILAMAVEASPDAFRRIIRLAKDADDHATQLRAAQYIIDRACGKPKQETQLSAGEGGLEIIVNIVEKTSGRTD